MGVAFPYGWATTCLAPDALQEPAVTAGLHLKSSYKEALIAPHLVIHPSGIACWFRAPVSFIALSDHF